MSNVVKFQTDLRVVICCDCLSLRKGMAKDEAVDVEKHDEHLFLGCTTDFLGDGDSGVFHIVDYSFDSNSYRLITTRLRSQSY